MTSGAGRARSGPADHGRSGPAARGRPDGTEARLTAEGRDDAGRRAATTGRSDVGGRAGPAGRTVARGPATRPGGDTGRRDGPSSRSGAQPKAGATRRWRLVRAGSDAVPPSVRRFMRRARQRRLRAALPWASIGVLLALAGLTAWLVYGTGLFGVRDIQVTGADLVTPAAVREAAAVPDGLPLARVELVEVERRIAALPPVDRVTVSRKWPDALVVEVVERTPVAAVPQGDAFVVVDRAGVVFQTVSSKPADLPLVRIATPGRNDPATRAGMEVLNSLTPELREQLAELVVDGPARVKLTLRGNRTVIWGDPSLGETKARVATSLLSLKGDTIDVSAPEVVTIR